MCIRPDQSVLLCTAESRLEKDEEDCMYFCMKVPKYVILQSSVLEGMSGTAGVAQLPSQVTDQDFLLWRHSNFDCPPECCEELSRLVKV